MSSKSNGINWADVESSEDEEDEEIEHNEVPNELEVKLADPQCNPPYHVEISCKSFEVTQMTSSIVRNFFSHEGCDIVNLKIENGIAYLVVRDERSIRRCIELHEYSFSGNPLNVKFVGGTISHRYNNGVQPGSYGRDNDNRNREQTQNFRDRDGNLKFRDNRKNFPNDRKYPTQSKPTQSQQNNPPRRAQFIPPPEPPQRPKLIINPRTLPLDTIGKPIASLLKPDIFGSGKPQDESEYESRRATIAQEIARLALAEKEKEIEVLPEATTEDAPPSEPGTSPLQPLEIAEPDAPQHPQSDTVETVDTKSVNPALDADEDEKRVESGIQGDLHGGRGERGGRGRGRERGGRGRDVVDVGGRGRRGRGREHEGRGGGGRGGGPPRVPHPSSSALSRDEAPEAVVIDEAAAADSEFPREAPVPRSGGGRGRGRGRWDGPRPNQRYGGDRAERGGPRGSGSYQKHVNDEAQTAQKAIEEGGQGEVSEVASPENPVGAGLSNQPDAAETSFSMRRERKGQFQQGRDGDKRVGVGKAPTNTVLESPPAAAESAETGSVAVDDEMKRATTAPRKDNRERRDRDRRTSAGRSIFDKAIKQCAPVVPAPVPAATSAVSAAPLMQGNTEPHLLESSSRRPQGRSSTAKGVAEKDTAASSKKRLTEGRFGVLNDADEED